jgi:tetratricopeptide (TPR) repeat protein
MADAIIVRLSLEKQIEVTPTTAVSRYDGSAVTSQSIARELGVESVMEGSVQRDDGRVRVVARLLRGADGATLWTGTFEQAFHDIFAMQDSITEQIASALLNRAIDFSPIRLERKETGEPDAYEAYLTGLHFMARRTEDGLRRAIELFSKAIAVDSRYARAYSGLAQSYDLIGAYSAYPPHEAFSNAIAASSMAIALDPSLAEAYAALAFAKAHRDYDWIAAEGGYQRAIDLAPGYATARQWRALALAAQGHAREAIEECLRALKSDPVSLIINTDLARHYYYSGRMEDAANRLRRTIDLDPSFMRAHYELGRVYKQREMYDLALTELDRAMQLSNRSPIVLAEIGAVHALVGHREEAFAARRELEDRTAGGHVSQYHVAVLLSALGDHNATINALAAAHEERFNWIVFINVEPNFRQLKSLPSFRALVQRLRLDSTS